MNFENNSTLFNSFIVLLLLKKELTDVLIHGYILSRSVFFFFLFAKVLSVEFIVDN